MATGLMGRSKSFSAREKVLAVVLSSLLVMTTCSCQAYGTTAIEDNPTPMADIAQGENENKDDHEGTEEETLEASSETGDPSDDPSEEESDENLADGVLDDSQMGGLFKSDSEEESLGVGESGVIDEVISRIASTFSATEETVDELDPVAVANDDFVEVGTWKELRENLSNGKSVRLSATIQVDDTNKAVIKSGQNQMLDFNGYQIRIEKQRMVALFEVNVGGHLTVMDSKSSKDAPSIETSFPKKVGEYDVAAGKAGKKAEWDEATGKLTYYVTRSTPNEWSGTTSEQGEVYELDIPAASTTAFEGTADFSADAAGVFNGEQGLSHDSLFTVNGELVIESGTFSGFTKEWGAVVKTDNSASHVTVNGGVFSDNRWVFRLVNTSDLDIHGGLYYGNKDHVVYVETNAISSDIEVRDSLFIKNTSKTGAGEIGNGCGSVIYCYFGGPQRLDIENSQFIDNFSSNSGGAISIRSYFSNPAGNIVIGRGSLFALNSTKGDGGAIELGEDSPQAALTTNGGITIKDDAIFAKNTARAAGALRVGKRTTAHIQGEALFVGNEAKGAAGDGSAGGAIKVATGVAEQLVLQDQVVFSGNIADHYAGAVMVGGIDPYGEPTEDPYCVVSGDVVFSNNRVEQSGGSGNTFGGGAMRIDGHALIKGGQFTSNYSEGHGGAIVSVWALSGSKVVLKRDGNRVPIVAANYANAYEGGGLCLEGGFRHSVYSAFITNNECGTTRDYGGGGIFVSQKAALALLSPLVTENTAAGMGGGIAGCKTSEIITCAAAVFGNTAKQEVTCALGGQNEEQGDGQWVDMMNAMTPADKEKASGVVSDESSFGASSADCYLGCDGKVYSNMLGGGSVNWRGFVLIDENDKMEHPAYNDSEQRQTGMRDQNGALKNEVYLKKVIGANGKEIQVKHPYAAGKAQYGVAYEVVDFPEDSVKAITDTEKPKAMLSSVRMIGLQANPTVVDQARARQLATVFVTGNYAATNGGGIANNGDLTVGTDPYPFDPNAPQDPDPKPEPITGRLMLTKALAGDTSALTGSATAVFKVNGFVRKQDLQNQAEPFYSNVIAFTFDAAHTGAQQAMLENLPQGYYRVEEVSYEQDNFNDEAVGNNVYEFIISPSSRTEGDSRVAIFEVKFTNTYEDEGGNGSGVVNAFEDDDGGLNWHPAESGFRAIKEGE